MNARTHEIAALDRAHFWHPFTPMAEWCAPENEPLVLAEGRGPYLWDTEGRRYFDGNSSIWTNLHGHGHPRIVAAISEQAKTLAHCSALGSTNKPASRLASALASFFPGELTRVFFSDDGSTAVECALKMALQFWQLEGQPRRRVFACFDQAYHGDTAGAAALGGIGRFHSRFAGLGVPTLRVRDFDELTGLDGEAISSLAGVVIEPLIQGAAGMKLWPPGMLRALRQWCDAQGIFLLCDEVMTGFGRTGTMFACQREAVIPDFLCLAKGLTGGTVPLAATLTSERVFQAFLGPERTFYYGHSYTGNPLGCAAALASLAIFEEEQTLARLPAKIDLLGRLLQDWQGRDRHVGAVRQCGLIAGIDLAQADGSAFPARLGTGAKVCHAARKHGLLTRPIQDTLVLMPPLCAEQAHLREAVRSLEQATRDTLPTS